MAEVSIQTTQNVSVNYRIADLGDRILGQAIDILIKVAYFIIVYLLLLNYMLKGLSGSWVLNFLLFIPPYFYTVLSEYFLNGQTLGKMVAKTKVIRLDGGEARLGNYIMRWIFKLIDDYLFFFVVGLISIAVSEKGQRIGDIVAGTTVIKLKRNNTFSNVIPHLPEIEDYKMAFPQVEKLSDNDINIIREAYANAVRTGNYVLLDSLSRKIKEVMQIQATMSDPDFIKTVLQDYNHYHSDPSKSFAKGY